MKKKLLLTGLIISAVFYGNVAAQLPKPSTESDPVWYYMQVTGSGTTADRVATVVGENVEGLPMTIDNVEAMNRQLWRFELSSMETENGVINGYIIISKTGKKLAVTYDPAKKLRTVTAGDDLSMLWRFVSSGTGYNIRIAFEPSEGTAGEINLYQTTASNNFALILTGSTNSSTEDARFKFVLNGNPVISSENDIVWMHIKNSKTGKFLTDVTPSALDGVFFSLDSQKNDGNDISQQWKMIAKANGRLDFVNRATGNVIHTNTVFDRSYYYLQYSDDPNVSDGWALTSLGLGQFSIYTTSAEGVVKYWHATTPDQPAAEYIEANARNSTYSWAFTWVNNSGQTSIKCPSLWEEDIHVYSSGQRIYVIGCDDYKITTLFGTVVAHNENLPTGIYLVTVKGKTTKLLVK